MSSCNTDYTKLHDQFFLAILHHDKNQLEKILAPLRASPIITFCFKNSEHKAHLVREVTSFIIDPEILSRTVSTEIYEEFLRDFGIPIDQIDALCFASCVILINKVNLVVFNFLLEIKAPPIAAMRFNACFFENKKILNENPHLDSLFKEQSVALEKHFPQKELQNIQLYVNNRKLFQLIKLGQPLRRLSMLFDEEGHILKKIREEVEIEGNDAHGMIMLGQQKKIFLESLAFKMKHLSVSAILSELLEEEGMLGLAPVENAMEAIDEVITKLTPLLDKRPDLLHKYVTQLQHFRSYIGNGLTVDDWLSVRDYNFLRASL